jgi:hypothetical protein
MAKPNPITRFMRRLFGAREPAASIPAASQASLPVPIPVEPRVFLITFNPHLPQQNSNLQQFLHWNDPQRLTAEFIQDLHELSYGYARYRIVEQVVDESFPAKVDGFTYTPESYLSAYRTKSGFHQPDGVDYQRLLAKYNLIQRIRAGEFDEIWWMGFPYAGFYESRMGGPGAFWCNAPPLENSAQAGRRFVIMGFSYERGVGEMLESYGHRAESILAQVYRARRGDQNLWERFTRHEKTHPGRAEVGNIHFAPNSRRDYDWGNPQPVAARADNWLRFPHIEGQPVRVNSQAWGGGDIREHHRWWFSHLPHISGQTNGISNNWWEYIVDPNRVV